MLIKLEAMLALFANGHVIFCSSLELALSLDNLIVRISVGVVVEFPKIRYSGAGCTKTILQWVATRANVIIASLTCFSCSSLCKETESNSSVPLSMQNEGTDECTTDLAIITTILRGVLLQGVRCGRDVCIILSNR